MSWFNTSGFASLAKSALSQAQKTIDKALDIREQEAALAESKSKTALLSNPGDTEDFFASFGLDEQHSDAKFSHKPATSKSHKSKGGLQLDESIGSIWGSFTGSFFDPGGSERNASYVRQSAMIAEKESNVTIASQPKKLTNHQRPRTVSLGDPRSSGHVACELLTSSESVPQLSEIGKHEYHTISISKDIVPFSLESDEQCVTGAPKRSGPLKLGQKKIPDDPQSQFDEFNQTIQTVIGGRSDPNIDTHSETITNENMENILAKNDCKSEMPIKNSDNLEKDESNVNFPIETPDSSLLIVAKDVSIALNLQPETECASKQISASEADCNINITNAQFSINTGELSTANKPEKEDASVAQRSDRGNTVENENAGAGSLPSSDTTCTKESQSQFDKDVLETIFDSVVPQPLEDAKASSLSFISLSSSSTTGESSSTLDESMGALSVLSEKEGHLSSQSSTTLTPEVFSDSGELFMPVGMNSSWDLGDGNAEYAPTAIIVEDKQQIRAEDGANVSDGAESRSDLDVTLTEESDQNVEELEFTTEKSDGSQSLGTQDSMQIPSSDKTTSETLKKKNNRSPSSSSLVSYMLEDAMVESASGIIGQSTATTTRAYSPHSSESSTSSNAERSDPVKTTESEQNSGQTSGDEIETTTSSDIEIISSPSMGGESGCERGGSISPIKPSSVWRSKTNNNSRGISSKYGGSIRSESPSSDTSSTKDCHLYQTSTVIVRPDLTFTPATIGKSKHQRKISEASSEESDGYQARLEALMKRMSDMTSILEARERKVLELSHENIAYKEKMDHLQSQLQKVEEVHAADTRDVSTLTKELTERLSNTEKKLQQALKEKDTFKHDLQQATVEIASRVSATQVEDMKKEKDAQIVELMQEGESLSKKVLQYSNNVKKLRAKEKENENHIKQQREKIEEQSRELERIRKTISAKEEVEKNQIELIRQLTNTVNKQEKEISSLKSDLEDAQEKQRSMKSAMESAYKELAELHRKNVEKDSQAQEAALSAEMSAKEELRMALEKLQHESQLQQETLIFQIEDLQVTLSRNEKQAALREDSLRQDISNLQQRLQQAEGRNDELNQNVSATTRPLLRQIDNLQSTLNIQTSSWERVERNLTDRLNETQNQLAHVTEKERAIAEKYADVSSKVASLEAQCSLLRQEKARLQAVLEASNIELQLIKESKEKNIASLETLKRVFKEEITSLKRERDMLEHQLEIEKTALEAEKRKTSLLQDQLKEKEQKFSQQGINLEGSRHNSPSPQSSMRGSFSDQLHSSWYQDDAFESSTTFPSIPNRMNVYESLRAGSMATLLDSLQSQLKLRDGDISQLQSDIGQLERVKESMTDELVKMNAKIEELETEIATLKDQQNNFQEMGQQYNALLQMLGEKTEEAQELRLDLQDVKEMYKVQIDELLRRK